MSLPKTPRLDAFALAGSEMYRGPIPMQKYSFHYLLLVCELNILLVIPVKVDFQWLFSDCCSSPFSFHICRDWPPIQHPIERLPMALWWQHSSRISLPRNHWPSQHWRQPSRHFTSHTRWLAHSNVSQRNLCASASHSNPCIWRHFTDADPTTQTNPTQLQH